MGKNVQVLCERVVDDPGNDNLDIIELGESMKKPRWLAHLLFAKKVRKWAEEFSHQNTVIHSHERIDCHHLTTLHSTLYNFPRRKKSLSPRNWMNEYIEKRELSSISVQKIVPVSNLITIQISNKYPCYANKLVEPCSPGLLPINGPKHLLDSSSPVIGFMGREWKRKGLLKVLEIGSKIKKDIPGIRFCFAGFPKDEISKVAVSNLENIEFLGYVKSKESFFSKIDILLHPASKEAYGMVILEALSLGVPVLCSSESGASDSLPDPQYVLSYDSPVTLWSSKLKKLISELEHSTFPPRKMKTWLNVAEEYVQHYTDLLVNG